jgi:hypothetical protein
MFARDHDFARIRTENDYRRLVPLRTSAELWQRYSDALTQGEAATWPGPVHHLASFDSSTSPIIVTADLVQSHRTALLTALALAIDVRPHARLLSGALLFVGGDAALTPLRGARSANLEELTRSELPALLRPYTAVAPYSGDGSLHELSARAASLPVTCLVGNAGRLSQLAELLRERHGRASFRQIWPMLEVVLVLSCGPADPTREQLVEQIGDRRVLLIEACSRPEGVVGIEDPRHGLLRLLPDHGVYFEFVPVDELGRTRPRRLGLNEIYPGTPYALAVTSAAGLWACQVGLTVTFERLDPPLLRSVDVEVPATTNEILPLRIDSPARAALPHRQIDDSQAAPAKRFARTPWSARADQR